MCRMERRYWIEDEKSMGYIEVGVWGVIETAYRSMSEKVTQLIYA